MNHSGREMENRKEEEESLGDPTLCEGHFCAQIVRVEGKGRGMSHRK